MPQSNNLHCSSASVTSLHLLQGKARITDSAVNGVLEKAFQYGIRLFWKVCDIFFLKKRRLGVTLYGSLTYRKRNVNHYGLTTCTTF
jgi:hypothetical protein